MSKKVITFGEIMLRLATPDYLRFCQANQFNATFGGGEANVAASLANYGIETEFVTRLPKNDIARACVMELRKQGIGTSKIIYGGERLGIYFLETGAVARASKVVYDRVHSSIAEIQPGMIDWDEVFKDASWFHWTGITPAISEGAANVCLEAIQAANRLGITVSCDLNYRKKLWTREQANKCMSSLMTYVDVCIANEEDAKDVFGIEADNTDIDSGRLSREGYISVASQLTEKFGFEKVAITLRGSISASDNEWSGMLYSGGKAWFSPNYHVHIVDRVGGGDSFGGGLIYSLINGWDEQKAIDFAVAASCLKHSIEHDFNLVSISEVENLAAGNASGRVQR